MFIKITSYDDFVVTYEKSPGYSEKLKQSCFTEWEQVRTELSSLLGEFGKESDPGMYNADFFLGEDWFCNRSVYVVILNWKIMNKSVIQQLQRYLSIHRQDYLVFIGKEIRVDGPDFEMLIARNDCAIAGTLMTKEEFIEQCQGHSNLKLLLNGSGVN